MGLHTGHPFVALFPVTLAILAELAELATLSVPSLTDSLPTRSGVVSAPIREAGTQATAGSSPPDPLATVWLQASLEVLNVRVAHKTLSSSSSTWYACTDMANCSASGNCKVPTGLCAGPIAAILQLVHLPLTTGRWRWRRW